MRFAYIAVASPRTCVLSAIILFPQKSHTGEAKQRCPLCFIDFSNHQNLKRHLQRKHGSDSVQTPLAMPQPSLAEMHARYRPLNMSLDLPSVMDASSTTDVLPLKDM